MNPVRLLRFQAGKTLAEVSEGAGVAIGTLRRVEGGKTPTAPVAKSLADFYGVQVEVVLGLVESAESTESAA